MSRALLRPTWRILPRGALVAGAALGLVSAGAPRLSGGGSGAGLGLALLRAAAFVFALGVGFLLDDPARHTTAAVPTRRPVRVGLRIALVAPAAVLWWTIAVLLIPARARPSLGAVTLEAAAMAVLALAVASVAVRYTEATEPGAATAVGLLAVASATPLLPERWGLVVGPDSPHWDSAHARWAVLLTGAALVLAASAVEPLRRRRIARPAHR